MMDNPTSVVKTRRIEDGIWYYFTVDLNFDGFASIQFIRYIDVNSNRKAAIVRILDKDYFHTRKVILLPYTREPNFFNCGLDDFLAVWTFDASSIGDAETIDLVPKWPKNILDKAGITPSIDVAIKWTKNS